MALVDFVKVTKYYGAQQVLSGLTFSIHPGEKIGLIGKNGSGKNHLYQRHC